ncbi:dual specificity protein phosphatase 18 [Stomoxys calcitrans]|uniref:Protein-tyrosine-phosphatase n=1 Tax=Stomoxys calcitrans TaxID=35570 RepID=A0A1I8PBT7_STOCA|nr:dual specificity protein phosphatase 18 [Stomoxys calcitrans]
MQILEQREPLRNTTSCNEKFEFEKAQSEKCENPQSFPGVSQLLPSLYLCGASVLSPTLITTLGINFVINASSELPDTPLPSTTNTLYLRVSIPDRPSAELSKHFDEVADMIEEVRLNGGKTLVHCVAGVSRSATLCLAYLMKYSEMSLREAFFHVKSIRPQIRPNTGFFQQLRCYEELRYGSQSVQMLFLECLQREIPDVYESEFRPMEEFYRRQRKVNRCAHEKPLAT